MKDETKKLIKKKIQAEDSYYKRKIKTCFEGIFLLFFYLLKNPLDNFWFECLSISIQYCDMLSYLIDKTVSSLYKSILVFSYLEAKRFY